ncbi:endolytic transglycosylase MltG [Patescibacteria group bacterium]|nr:endolytic transglycosylase MltG [Patescibacteria group bacterium]MBU1721515.1 endolytic transglycosylase MltG [Patescibacteria group bacterium]MBU1901481.1 endolytic transglycosylase MltG [Patescibacteria group bacterium]
MKKIIKKVILLIVIIGILAGYSTYHKIYKTTLVEEATFEVTEAGLSDLANRLVESGVIESEELFLKFMALKKYDKQVKVGMHRVEAPVTIARLAEAIIQKVSKEERTITLLPGWNLWDIARYFEAEGIATEEEVFTLLGKPAEYGGGSEVFYDLSIIKNKPKNVSYEGYLAMNTFRVFADASLEEIVRKLLVYQEGLLSIEMLEEIKDSGRTIHEVMTVASLVQREVQSKVDMAKVADIFWKRLDDGMGMQADSTVHYIFDDKGDVFTDANQRAVDSLWNTYKYRDLPPSPISNPGIEAIKAAIYPDKNDYYYFLTDMEGTVYYAKNYDAHLGNVNRYLR